MMCMRDRDRYRDWNRNKAREDMEGRGTERERERVLDLVPAWTVASFPSTDGVSVCV